MFQGLKRVESPDLISRPLPVDEITAFLARGRLA
jgi:hypothetical protein